MIKASADDARGHWLDEGRSAGGYIREVDFFSNKRVLGSTAAEHYDLKL